MVSLKRLLIKIMEYVPPFKFGVDSEGNYGYYKENDETTIIPFSNPQIGKIYSKTSTYTSWPAWGSTIVCSLDLPPGTYIITAVLSNLYANTAWSIALNDSTTGTGLSAAQAAANGQYHGAVNMTGITTINNTHTFVVYAGCSTVHTRTVTITMTAIQIA